MMNIWCLHSTFCTLPFSFRKSMPRGCRGEVLPRKPRKNQGFSRNTCASLVHPPRARRAALRFHSANLARNETAARSLLGKHRRAQYRIDAARAPRSLAAPRLRASAVHYFIPLFFLSPLVRVACDSPRRETAGVRGTIRPTSQRRFASPNSIAKDLQSRPRGKGNLVSSTTHYTYTCVPLRAEFGPRRRVRQERNERGDFSLLSTQHHATASTDDCRRRCDCAALWLVSRGNVSRSPRDRSR
jgi:hypothetical protein